MTGKGIALPDVDVTAADVICFFPAGCSTSGLDLHHLKPFQV